MKHELQVASEWWALQHQQELGTHTTHLLIAELEKAIYQKIKNHWYENEKYRGSGYRAILCDEYQTDDVLLSSLKSLGLTELIPKFKKATMFINPGEVIVKFGSYERLELYRKEVRCL
jgi:hypothetical protein